MNAIFFINLQTKKVEDFNSIRPYLDQEVSDVLSIYKDSTVFQKLANHVYPSWTADTFQKKLSKIKTTLAFQEQFVFPATKAAIDRSMDFFTVSGLENIDREENYLFISNHRDIVLDSSILFYVLYQNEFKIVETAIGNNLLTSQLVTDIVKLNQNFIVQRNLPTREMITASKLLSRYIRFVLNEKKMSIWISHREGRTKDGNDKTNPGVLKMISMDCEGDKIGYLLSLKIVPVSISYEFESCDALKAAELSEIELTGTYKKDGTEDMKSIITGITQQKGRVHLAFGQPIKRSDLAFSTDKIQDHFKELSEYIDKEIHQHFKLFPGNYIAYDLIHNTNKYGDRYNAWEKSRFTEHINQILKTRKDKKGFAIFNRILLNIYSNPVINQLENNNL